jgi:hypothetical protein
MASKAQASKLLYSRMVPGSPLTMMSRHYRHLSTIVR